LLFVKDYVDYVLYHTVLYAMMSPQCFNTAGWATGRASGL